jgi:hypothetical protein
MQQALTLHAMVIMELAQRAHDMPRPQLLCPDACTLIELSDHEGVRACGPTSA